MLVNKIPQGNPPVDLVNLEQEKSRLLFEGRLLRNQQDYEQAAERFIQAADIERQWAEWAKQEGLSQLALIHRYSEASCWAQGGNPYQALRLVDNLLALTDLPAEQRTDLEEYRASLHYQFVNWMGEWASATIPAD